MRQTDANEAAEVSDRAAEVAAFSDPGTQPEKAGKQREWRAASAAMAAGKDEHASLSQRA